ncbi:MAG: 3-octaprenyl-4-hydroxybenzoate carboxy-lyase [Ramlibacter sp.]|nr:3-octaprenyl-4-hydroxybenzoate carboxy-lyase [Ramlibacter sp.]
MKRLIVAITGASGVIYGVRLLEVLAQTPGWETDLVISPSAVMTLAQELDMPRAQVEALATRVHHARDIGASISSGSAPSAGMVIAPCSMRTLAGVAHGLNDNLIMRAADVALKERRRLVLLTRETPLNLAHLRNMIAVTEMGAIVAPPVPAFYTRPQTIEQLVNHTVGRTLDLFDIPHDSLLQRWNGMNGAG